MMFDGDGITGSISRHQIVNLRKGAQYFFRNHQCLGFSLLLFKGKLTGYYNKFITAKTGSATLAVLGLPPHGQQAETQITVLLMLRLENINSTATSNPRRTVKVH